MGIFRFLLAFGVVAEHCEIRWLAGSYTAVQAFFIVSGFYMSLILSGNYATARDFYLSRAFRLFPVYWIAALLAVAYYAVAAIHFDARTFGYQGFSSLAQAGLIGQIWYAFSSIFLVGLDAGFFFAWGDLPAIFSTPIPPAWTLSLELAFYLLCPWLAKRKTATLAAIIAILIIARIAGYAAGFDRDPWHARFFPFELAFFLAGMLCYRAYAALLRRPRLNRIARPVSAGSVLLLFTLLLVFYPIADAIRLPSVYGLHDYWWSAIFYALTMLSLPVLFHVTKNMRLDAYIGEYSYLIYVFHYIFVEIMVNADVVFASRNATFGIVAAVTLAHAAIANHLIQLPVDRYRRRAFRAAPREPVTLSAAPLQGSP